MRLTTLIQAPRMTLKDVRGDTIRLGAGSPVLLSFFRDAACPFCHKRMQELTAEYDRLHAAYGLKMVSVFASEPQQVKSFIHARPRPFPVAADPAKQSYDIYGVEHSLSRKLWAVFRRMPMWIGGVCEVGPNGAVKGLCGLNTNNIVPASFLIDGNRDIVIAHYGRDAGDHLPLEQIEAYLAGNTDAATSADETNAASFHSAGEHEASSGMLTA